MLLAEMARPHRGGALLGAALAAPANLRAMPDQLGSELALSQLGSELVSVSWGQSLLSTARSVPQRHQLCLTRNAIKLRPTRKLFTFSCPWQARY